MGLIGKAGFYAIELIEQQVEKGINEEGKAYKYSEKPFAMPGKFANQKKLVKEGRLKTFTTKQGKLWTMVMGGYKDFRKLKNRNPEGDYLTFTGKMLNSLSSRVESSSKVVIYFTSPEQSQKAFWLTVSGAGKSRKLWKFFGLTKESENKLQEFIKAGVNKDEELTAQVIEKIRNTLKMQK